MDDLDHQRPERNLGTGVPDEAHRQDDVQHHINIDAQTGKLDRIKREEQLKSMPRPGDQPIPDAVHHIVGRTSPIRGGAGY